MPTPCTDQGGGDLHVLANETCSLARGTRVYDAVHVEGTLVIPCSTVYPTCVTIQATDFTVKHTGRVTSDGYGYAANQGPGKGNSNGSGGKNFYKKN